MERCVRCDVNENEVRLFDAIYEGKMACLCERCSIIENIPIIKKPNVVQLKDSEKSVSISERERLKGGGDGTFFIDDELNKLEKNPEREMPEENKLNLIEHYHWEIMKCRRRKGLTHKQLASALGESEIAIQMIEKNKPPENGERLINKLEQFFQMKLRKVSEMERYMMEKEKEPILLDENGRELDVIPEPEPVFVEREEEPVSNEISSYEDSKELDRIRENYSEKEEEDLFKERYYPIVKKPEIHCKVEVKKDSETPLLDDEAVVECRVEPQSDVDRSERVVGNGMEVPQDLDLRKTNLNKVTINQLKDMHRKKIEVTRQERIEEQKKIEERQRIMEALRERDRIKQDEKINQERLERERVGMEKQRLIEERKRELQQVRDKESKDIDDFLGGSELLNRKGAEKIEDSKSVEEFDRELC